MNLADYRKNIKSAENVKVLPLNENEVSLIIKESSNPSFLMTIKLKIKVFLRLMNFGKVQNKKSFILKNFIRDIGITYVLILSLILLILDFITYLLIIFPKNGYLHI